jgi:hypothetical protein
MTNYNSFEEELDAIRIAFYEKTKDMTPDEEVAYLRAQAAPLHEQYHYRVISYAKKRGEEVSV